MCQTCRYLARALTRPKLWLISTLLVVMSGCTNSLVVEGRYPHPLVEPLPLSVAMVYDDDFRQFTYEEKAKERGKWIIAAGKSQQDLFDSVYGTLFTELKTLNELPAADQPSTSDLVIKPVNVEFQYSVPRETRFNVYEVWLKYNISAFEADGEPVADWIVTAYGKTPTAFMRSGEDAMNAAVVVALRDLGANLTLNTFRVPEMRRWLKDRTPTDNDVVEGE